MMDNKNAQFAGSIPAAYDRYLGPMFFQPYAEDIAARLNVAANGSVLELACGTGIVTRVLRDRLPATARLTATDLNERIFAHSSPNANANCFSLSPDFGSSLSLPISE